MKIKMADLVERDMEANFEHILKEILLELKDKGRKITLKDDQRKAVKQLYGKKDLVVVLPTGFGKSLIFQLRVLLENRNRNGHSQTASVLVICSLTSIINDQIMEVENMGLSACNLSQKLADLTDVEGGKYHVVYSSGESALDKRFLQSLKKDTVFSRRMVACVVDESHTIETWTGLR